MYIVPSAKLFLRLLYKKFLKETKVGTLPLRSSKRVLRCFGTFLSSNTLSISSLEFQVVLAFTPRVSALFAALVSSSFTLKDAPVLTVSDGVSLDTSTGLTKLT